MQLRSDDTISRNFELGINLLILVLNCVDKDHVRIALGMNQLLGIEDQNRDHSCCQQVILIERAKKRELFIKLFE